MQNEMEFHWNKNNETKRMTHTEKVLLFNLIVGEICRVIVSKKKAANNCALMSVCIGNVQWFKQWTNPF